MCSLPLRPLGVYLMTICLLSVAAGDSDARATPIGPEAILCLPHRVGILRTRLGHEHRLIYSEQLRPLVDVLENLGKLITIDIMTADYEIGDTHVPTVQRLRARHPDAVTCMLRIGYPATYSRGMRLRPLIR
jgi:hypothetical protein